MKILHAVESYYPSVGGAQEVVRQLSEHMAKTGHDVTVATRKLPDRKSLKHNGVKIVEFDIRPATPKSASIATGLKGEIKKYQDFLIKSDFDIIMTYAAQQWTTDLMFEIMDKIKAKKVLVPCGYSGLYDPIFKDYFKQLPEYLREFDATVYLSDDYRDVNFARKHKIKNTHLIPNGADEKEFGKQLSEAQKTALRKKYGIEGLMLMTIGNYTGEKGHLELLYVFKRLPVFNVTLVSAGSITPGVGSYDLFEQQAKRVNTSRKFPGKKIVMIDGGDRPLVRDMLKCADLFVFLSNIEASPLVLFEAAAAGVPFVTTAAGNSAEIAKWTNGGLVIKSNDMGNGRVKANLSDTVWKVTWLALSRRRRQQLGAAGRDTWQKKFTWAKLTQDYLKLYQTLLKREAVR